METIDIHSKKRKKESVIGMNPKSARGRDKRKRRGKQKEGAFLRK